MAVSMLLDHPDPVGAFWAAHESGSDIGLRTSGTLSNPRTVRRSTTSWITSFDAYSQLTGIDSEARIWIPGPLDASMNLFAAIHANNAKASLVQKEYEATHAVLTPARLIRCLDSASLQPPCHVVVAGDVLRATLRDRARAEGLAVSHYYGASELSFIAWGSAEDDLIAFPGVDIDIRNDVIWCRSPYLAHGYIGDDAGALRFEDDGFATVGDRGRLAGGVLHVFGRGDTAVTTGGSTVLVADIEQVLRAHARGEVVVLGVPHDLWGAVIVAVVTEDSDLDDLPPVAREELSPDQRPRRWVRQRELPMTAAGKVDRAALTSLVAGG